MIVVVGSRHDAVAAKLVKAWRGALCAAEDLTSAGWAWRSDGRPRTWLIAGARVDDREVSGVFVRRTRVHPEELTAIHPDDRPYVAAESQAFLTQVLATTAARVCNPVVDGAFGDDLFGLERLLAAASSSGVAVRPVRLTSERRRAARPADPLRVEVVGDRAFGDGTPRVHGGAIALAAALGVSWATFAFDGRRRLLAVSAAERPSAAATRALFTLLGGRR